MEGRNPKKRHWGSTKRRNSSLHLRSTLRMWNHNQTSAWMQRRRSNKSRQRLVAKAIKLAAEWKRKSREVQDQVAARIKQRMAENKNKKDEKSIKEAERRSTIIDAVINCGDICKTKEDLDSLKERSNALECL